MIESKFNPTSEKLKEMSVDDGLTTRGGATSVKPDMLFYVPAGLIAVLYFILYIRYSFQAWFHLDDFMFLWHYKNSLHIDELVTFANFGRFLSRNVYWYFMQATFGANSEYYFMANLLLLAVVSWLCFRLIRQLTNSQFIGAMSGLIYFVMVPSQMNFSWLSNIQHLSSHLFILGFLVLVCNQWFYLEPHRLGKSLAIMIVFVLGVYCNVAMVPAIPSMLVYIGLFRGFRDLDKFTIGPVLSLTLFSVIFWFGLRDNLHPAYAVHFTPSQLYDTFMFYAMGLGVKRMQCLVIWWIGVSLVVLALLVCLFKKDFTGCFLFVLAVLFYMPYAFLVHQRYPNYMALPCFFLSSLMIYVIVRYLRAPALIYVVVLCHILVSIKVLRVLYDQPALACGKAQKAFIAEINGLHLKDQRRVCLKGLEPLRPNKTGVAYWDISPFWHNLGDGDALKLFGSVGAALFHDKAGGQRHNRLIFCSPFPRLGRFATQTRCTPAQCKLTIWRRTLSPAWIDRRL